LHDLTFAHADGEPNYQSDGAKSSLGNREVSRGIYFQHLHHLSIVCLLSDGNTAFGMVFQVDRFDIWGNI